MKVVQYIPYICVQTYIKSIIHNSFFSLSLPINFQFKCKIFLKVRIKRWYRNRESALWNFMLHHTFLQLRILSKHSAWIVKNLNLLVRKYNKQRYYMKSCVIYKSLYINLTDHQLRNVLKLTFWESGILIVMKDNIKIYDFWNKELSKVCVSFGNLSRLTYSKYYELWKGHFVMKSRNILKICLIRVCIMLDLLW